MARTLSNYVKALLCVGHLDSGQIKRAKCFTVLSFDYSCQRSRNKAGFPYDFTTSSVLNGTIKMLRPDDSKAFYEATQNNVPQPYTFLFNATFDENNSSLKDFEDAMIVSGCMINVDEDFNTSTEGGKANDSQMLLKFSILVSSITYRGSGSERKLIVYG